MIFFNDPKKFYLSHKNELIKTTKKFFDSGQYIKSTALKIFEKNFANYLGIKYCVGVASATDALFISLKVLGIGNGDEVLLPSHTATGTGAAILQAGATPVFVDIKKNSFNIDPNLIISKITKKTKAIIPVHLYGEACEIEEIIKIAKKFNIKVIEDCSQSFGAKYKNKHTGTFGDIGCFSFYPTKNLGCFGDGGAIVTNKKKYFELVVKIREYGWDMHRNAVIFGINSRLDELQAYYLNLKLKYFDKDLIKKKIIYERYVRYINNPYIKIFSGMNSAEHSHHLFVILVKKRKNFISMLSAHKIIAGIHYKLPLHKQKIFKKFHTSTLSLTEFVSKRVVSIPIYPELKYNEQIKIINLINSYK
jgi:dTDP-4-amino-4,6-dideoxygalactose transaminase